MLFNQDHNTIFSDCNDFISSLIYSMKPLLDMDLLTENIPEGNLAGAKHVPLWRD
jgi:hypothetical protein